MRSFIPVLIGLATVAVAQNSTTDCVSAYSKCYNFDTSNANVCSSDAATCKDRCSTSQSNCLSSGASKDDCSTRYNACIGATPDSKIGMSCLSQAVPCYASSSHDTTNACDSKLGNCKDACGAIKDLCNSTGNDNSELCSSKYSMCLGANNATVPSTSCMAQGEQAYLDKTPYNTLAAIVATCKNTCGVLNDACMSSQDTSGCASAYQSCLGSGKVTKSSVHCVAEVETLIESGKPSNDVQADNAQCKDFCARQFDTCNSANDSANNSTCLAYYTSCVGANDLPKLSSSCLSASEDSYMNSTADNTADSDLADCKANCGMLQSTCLSSGDASVKDQCLSFYQSCTGGSNTTTSALNCVASSESCYLNGTDDNTCDASNAQCKNQCTRAFSTCTSSGDPSVTEKCEEFYLSCLGSSKLVKPTIDCVARNDACYLSGSFTDAECDSQNAVCKTVCSRSQDTCMSGNSTSVVDGCNTHYNQCLGAANVTAVSPVSCVNIATDCFLQGTASNNCSAITATCKSSCSRSQDTCLSSGDASVKPACDAHYDTCLGATPAAEDAAKNINCIERFTSCFSSGVAENECEAQNAQCKNTCSQLLDSCNSSGDNSTAPQCQGVYNACLGSIATSLVNYKPLDCAGRNSMHPSNQTAAEHDRLDASCKNACSVTLDTCLVSGSSDKAACDHLYMMCLDVNSYQVTSIPPTMKPTTPATSSTMSASTTASGSVETGDITTSASRSVATSVESTAYVTDVEEITVTTCPAGQTVTQSGMTTVLTAPTVITSHITRKSTVTRRVTVTVPTTAQNTMTTSVPSASTEVSPVATSVESTTYVTDVVSTTVTTCPAGQTVTQSGVTTVLTAPSVMTSHITIRSTIASTVTRTAVVPESSSTATLYTTQVLTVTRCGAGDTNCVPTSTMVSFPTGITVTSVVSPIQSTGSSSAPVTIESTKYFYRTSVITVTRSKTTVVKTTVIPTSYVVTSVISSASKAVTSSAPYSFSNSTMVGPHGTVGTTSGKPTTTTTKIPFYTGAASKAGAAGIAGVAALAAFLL
jgi:hypothetical protein